MQPEKITPEPAKEDIRWVPISEVACNSWNPNKMQPNVFNELAKDIKDQGMDQPVVVIPAKTVIDGGGEVIPGVNWIIVDGEHRYLAHRAAGATHILISVKNWNLRDAQIHTIRRNLHGETDAGKFTKLVTGLASTGLTHEEIRSRMVMSDKQFAKLYQSKTVEKAKIAKEVIEGADKGVAQTFLVANLSQMVRDIIKEYGDTIHQGFLCFSFKGQTHFMISMDSPLSKALQAFQSACEEDKLTQAQISKLLTDAINKAV